MAARVGAAGGCDDAAFEVLAAVSNNVWPAIPSGRGAQLLSLLLQLEQSQWLSPLELIRRSAGQLHSLLTHALEHVPYYREHYTKLGFSPDTIRSADEWRRLPVLSREDVQAAGDQLHTPPELLSHGRIEPLLTSGSTGKPVAVMHTSVAGLFWSAFALREHLWQRRNFQLTTASIRTLEGAAAKAGPDARSNTWGAATKGVIRTGPSSGLDIRTPIDEQAQWLLKQEPDYLITYPSNAFALARHFQQHDLKLSNLRELRLFGEQLEPFVRRECQATFGVKITDVYSSQEFGHLALQCPEHEHYHVQSENVLLEVLHDDGQPCAPGEVGRVVVTGLHNFATPLIRYEIGDYAEVGARCPCGRGLPVLNRIMGRQRNLAVLPDGRRVWPAVQLESPTEITNFPPIQQFQLIQRTREAMELLLVCPRPLSESEEQLVRAWANEAIGHPFDIAITYVDAIPRGPGGKYEDFRCEVEL